MIGMSLRKMILIVGLLLCSLSYGRDIYVDNTGNDVTNNGSISQPYRTINKAALEAVAGDNVIIKSGTYFPTTRISVANSGLPGAPITFKAEVQDEVIIDGIISSSPTSGDRLGLFNIQGTTTTYKSYIVIDGLQIINSNWAGFFARYTDNITVKNCRTTKTGASGIIGANSSNITVLNNVVKEACIFPSRSQNTNECITMASVDVFEVAYNTVSDRLIDFSNGGEGIDAKNECKDGSIHHNTVFNLIRVGIYVDAFQRNINNIDVYANTVYACLRGGITVASEEGGIASDIQVHDNLIYNIGRVGLRIAGYLNNGPLQNIDVYQNTIYDCGSQGNFENCGILLEASNPANFGFNIRNNIVSGCPLQIKSNFSQPFPVTIANNLFFGNIGGFSANTLFTNTINANPLHVNIAALDFTLQSNSPAINMAIGSPLSTIDFNGVARPQGAQGDLGAFEYVSTLPVTLLSFTGNLQKEHVQLKWTTSREINASHYLVEKSSNGISFNKIGIVSARNVLLNSSYSFDDLTLNPCLQYYRLKMMDKDGSFAYSKILAIRVGVEYVEIISVYPNPVTNFLTVQLSGSDQTNQYIKIVGMDGRVVALIAVGRNVTQTKVDVSKLSRGNYILVFVGSHARSSASFVK